MGGSQATTTKGAADHNKGLANTASSYFYVYYVYTIYKIIIDKATSNGYTMIQ